VTPVLVNLTTGSLLGFAGLIPFGQTLAIARANPETKIADRALKATLDGNDVTHLLFSIEGFELGVPFSKQQQAPKPLLPGLQRGVNEWIFCRWELSTFAVWTTSSSLSRQRNYARARLTKQALTPSLFPSGAIAKLEMSWTETEPASFEVRVPRYLIIEPAGTAASESIHAEVAQGLQSSVEGLRAAGVKALVRFCSIRRSAATKSSGASALEAACSGAGSLG